MPAPSAGFYMVANSVATSGDTIVISNIIYSGGPAVFVFVKRANGWSNMHPTAELMVPTTNGFPSLVAISGDTIVVGIDDGQYGPGTAYVFVKPSGGWTDINPTATLTSSDSTMGDGFGESVSINGDTIVVGSGGADSGAGAAYVFVKPPGGWANMTQTAKLTASDSQPDLYLGRATSMSANTIVLGTYNSGTGKSYVYVKPTAGWADMTQTAELTIKDTQYSDAGASIANTDDTVLVGSPDYYPVGAGSVYLWTKPAGGWINATQTATLTAADRRHYDAFGAGVAIKGKIAVVGASGRTRGMNWGAGGVYVFHEPPGGWTSMSSDVVLTGSDTRHNSSFGYSVDVDGGTVVAGAPFLLYRGAAYVFGLP
jgi:hypothetical protein